MSLVASPPTVSRVYWWVAAAALVWNLMGLAAFVMQVLFPEVGLAGLPAEQRALYDAIPWWGMAAFAVAVVGGTVGSVGLLIRKRWAVPAFIASCVGALVQDIQMFGVSRVQDVMGWGAVVFPLLVLGVGLALITWSRRLAARGVLR